MNAVFGFSQTPKFKAALDKTTQTFEKMSAQEVFELARKHANGDIAKFVAHTDQSN
jgi:hypothetical protein